MIARRLRFRRISLMEVANNFFSMSKVVSGLPGAFFVGVIITFPFDKVLKLLAVNVGV